MEKTIGIFGSIYDARNNFSALVKKAESGEPVELTRHNKPVAIILSRKENSILKIEDWWEA